MTAMSERQLDALIEDARKALGIRLSYHTHDSRRSAAGFPDRVYCGPGGVLFRELKTDTGKLSAEQHEWNVALYLAGVDIAVWRPEDWPDRIFAELRAIAKPRSSQPRGRASPTSVKHRLESLRSNGAIDYRDNLARSIVVLRGCCPSCHGTGLAP